MSSERWNRLEQLFAEALALPMAHDPAGMSASLLLDGERQELKDDRAGYDRFHGLYRLAADVGDGHFTLDLDGSALRQDPTSPHPREGNILSPRFPVDANVNPSDAKQNTDRIQFNAGFDHKLGFGDWITTFSIDHSKTDNIRGFLREDSRQAPRQERCRGKHGEDSVQFHSAFGGGWWLWFCFPASSARSVFL